MFPVERLISCAGRVGGFGSYGYFREEEMGGRGGAVSGLNTNGTAPGQCPSQRPTPVRANQVQPFTAAT